MFENSTSNQSLIHFTIDRITFIITYVSDNAGGYAIYDIESYFVWNDYPPSATTQTDFSNSNTNSAAAYQESTISGAAYGNGTYRVDINKNVNPEYPLHPFNYVITEEDSNDTVYNTNASTWDDDKPERLLITVDKATDFRMLITIPYSIVLEKLNIFNTSAFKNFKLYIASDIDTPIGSEILDVTNNSYDNLYWNQWSIPSPSSASNKYLLVVEAGTTNYTSRVYIQISEVRLIGYKPPLTVQLSDSTNSTKNVDLLFEDNASLANLTLKSVQFEFNIDNDTSNASFNYTWKNISPTTWTGTTGTITQTSEGGDEKDISTTIKSGDELLLPVQGQTFTCVNISKKVTIYVGEGLSQTPPYFNFYDDIGGSNEITDLKIDTTKSYTFYRTTSASTDHPFYISDQGWRGVSSDAITITGDGNETSGITGSQSFTLSFNAFNIATDTLTYYCTNHSIMVSTFTCETDINNDIINLVEDSTVTQVVCYDGSNDVTFKTSSSTYPMIINN